VESGEEVDVIKAPRSSGSILKPLLYASMLQEGQILPDALIPDIPTQLNGFRPENFLETYDGVVPAKKAVSRSLNVPFVRMLQNYGVEKFHFRLKKLGLTTLRFSPNHYGLTLILGGAECTLWDITNVYACMGRTLNHFYPLNGRYDVKDFRKANYLFQQNPPPTQKGKLLQEAPFLSADAIWFTLEAMDELERPVSEGDWERFQSSRRIAWKTGTSFGFRDAWAIGVTPRFAVGIWAGNADGEGRPGLVGVYAAAPLLFDLFELLPASNWFDPPFDEMKKTVVCKKSGYLALDFCEKDTLWAPGNALNSQSCPYHQIVHLDRDKKWRITSHCESPANMELVPWFILPPVEEFYFKTKNPSYRPVPSFREGCNQSMVNAEQPMQLIYPKQVTKIYVPVDLNGELSRTVFKIAHRNPEKKIYWHLDNEYIGSTTTFHSMELNPGPGNHVLTVVDEKGNRLEQSFEILVR
jgi:penicillin-binding protein 1C